MRDYKLKLTVSEAQETKIRSLVDHTVSQYPVLYDSLSGINLQQGTILVPFNKRYAVIEKFIADGLCTLTEGKISEADTEVESVDLDESNQVVVTFTSPAYLTEEIAVADFIAVQKTEDHGVSLETATTADLIADAVTALDFGLDITPTNPSGATVVLTEIGVNGIVFSQAVITGTGTLSANTVTAATAGTVAITLNGDFVADDTIEVAGETVTFYTNVSTAGTVALTLNEGFVAGDTIEVAGETVTFYTNPTTAGVINITLNELFYAGDTITVAGETVTFYATEAAKGADTHGVALETSTTATAQATAIAAMTFAGFTVTNPGAKQVRFTETVAGSQTIEVATAEATFGDFTVNTAVPNVGAGDTHGVSLAAAANATAQATAIAALTFTGYAVTNPGEKQVLFTESVAGAETISVAVVTGTGTLAVNTATPNEGANDAFGVDLATATTAALQATAISGMTFTGYTVTNPGAGQVLFTESVKGEQTIAVAVVTGTGTLAANVATQAVEGYLTLTFNNDFVDGDSIAVLGKTINFYDTDANLAATLVDVGLTSTAIAAETENDYHTIHEFDLITEDITGVPELFVTFGTALGSFEDENGNTVATTSEVFTIDLT